MLWRIMKISLGNGSRAAGDRCPVSKVQRKGVLPWEEYWKLILRRTVMWI